MVEKGQPWERPAPARGLDVEGDDAALGGARCATIPARWSDSGPTAPPTSPGPSASDAER